MTTGGRLTTGPLRPRALDEARLPDSFRVFLLTFEETTEREPEQPVTSEQLVGADEMYARVLLGCRGESPVKA